MYKDEKNTRFGIGHNFPTFHNAQTGCEHGAVDHPPLHQGEGLGKGGELQQVGAGHNAQHQGEGLEEGRELQQGPGGSCSRRSSPGRGP